MAEARQLGGNEVGGNVFSLFDPTRPAVHREPHATDEELADFRKYWPLMKQMLRQWEAVTASGGCPVAREIITP